MAASVGPASSDEAPPFAADEPPPLEHMTLERVPLERVPLQRVQPVDHSVREFRPTARAALSAFTPESAEWQSPIAAPSVPDEVNPFEKAETPFAASGTEEEAWPGAAPQPLPIVREEPLPIAPEEPLPIVREDSGPRRQDVRPFPDHAFAPPSAPSGTARVSYSPGQARISTPPTTPGPAGTARVLTLPELEHSDRKPGDLPLNAAPLHRLGSTIVDGNRPRRFYRSQAVPGYAPSVRLSPSDAGTRKPEQPSGTARVSTP
jgi:hypothetical protein